MDEWTTESLGQEAASVSVAGWPGGLSEIFFLLLLQQSANSLQQSKKNKNKKEES